MSVAARLGVFALALVAVFVAAVGVGRATGPVGPVGPVSPVVEVEHVDD